MPELSTQTPGQCRGGGWAHLEHFQRLHLGLGHLARNHGRVVIQHIAQQEAVPVAMARSAVELSIVSFSSTLPMLFPQQMSKALHSIPPTDSDVALWRKTTVARIAYGRLQIPKHRLEHTHECMLLSASVVARQTAEFLSLNFSSSTGASIRADALKSRRSPFASAPATARAALRKSRDATQTLVQQNHRVAT